MDKYPDYNVGELMMEDMKKDWENGLFDYKIKSGGKMNRTLTIFFDDGSESEYKVNHIFNPNTWDEFSSLHFRTTEGKSYSVRTRDIERVEIEVE
ncbi:hypothetical protein [Oceanispirochaeta sp.]|jgi:hypothetical protein|uniref:hypothetical protein n=1 Tax=Oceanispirochaeta sp. TaxID=2035350 RepID=UPI0026132BDD|nr:hypothetical protein [Oceanispirochaeta sp.]MDA3958396.1 hypothetical protein [Oceanispirochaeta sp.]